jgi:hypothetical protein
VFDTGGPGVLCYRDLIQLMARELGLRPRLILPVPVLTRRLISYWIHMVTPLNHTIARPLAEGLRNPVACRDNRIREILPQPLLSVRDAICAALCKLAGNDVETTWPMAGPIPGDPDWAGGTVFGNVREILIAAPARIAFRAEMKLPSEALLEFRIEPWDLSHCRLRQIALFKPCGLFGLLYWYAVVPFHHIVFRGMLLGIRREAIRFAAAS